MKRYLRWIMGVLCGLFLSIFLLILALPHLVNPNDYKTIITDLVREKTGRVLVIAGDLQLQVSPWLNVTCTLGKTTLANNAPFPNSTFIESEQAKIELSLLPFLLHRRLHMEPIMLDGVTLNLLRNKDGRGNWEDLVQQPETAKGATEEATTEATVSVGDQRLPVLKRLLLGVTGVDLGQLQLAHINVRYDNRQTERIIVLKDLMLKTGRIREEGLFPFEAEFNLALDNKAAIIHSGDIAMQGNATLFLQEPHLLLEDLRMEGTVKGQTLPKRGLKVVLSTNSDIDLRHQKITIKDFSLNHEDALLQGSGTLDGFSSPRFNLSLKVPDCSPRSILKQLKAAPPPLQDAEALTHLSAGMQVNGNMEMAEITDLTVTVDDTTVTGTIKVNDLMNPAYEAVLHINDLDLDRYGRKKTAAPPETGGEQTAALVDAEQAAPSPPIIPVSFLKPLLLQLDLQLDSLKVGGAHLSQVQIKAVGKDGILQLAPVTAHLYDGSMKLAATIDVTGDVPQVQVKQKFNKVQLGPLFRDRTGKEEVTGAALIEGDINTSGLAWKDLLSHISGTIRFEILKGEIKPLKILQIIRTTRSRALYRNETISPVTVDGATGFDRLSGTGILEDGIFYNDDLKAGSELMQITGGGEIDLVRRQVDFLLNVALSPDLVQDKKMGLTEFGDKTIPYTIVGPFIDLRQEADVARLLTAETDQQPLKESPKQADKKETMPEKKGTDTSPAQKEKGVRGD